MSGGSAARLATRTKSNVALSTRGAIMGERGEEGSSGVKSRAVMAACVPHGGRLMRGVVEWRSAEAEALWQCKRGAPCRSASRAVWCEACMGQSGGHRSQPVTTARNGAMSSMSTVANAIAASGLRRLRQRITMASRAALKSLSLVPVRQQAQRIGDDRECTALVK